MNFWNFRPDARLWLIAGVALVALFAGLAVWAVADFGEYQREFSETLQALENKAEWRAAEASQHAAGFAYGSMVVALFSIAASVLGILVVGLTLKSTIDLAHVERRPWLSITEIRDVKVRQVIVPDGSIEFCVQATFDIRNSGMSPARHLCRFEMASLDDEKDQHLNLLKEQLHRVNTNGHSLTNVAPDHSLKGIMVAKTFKLAPGYDETNGLAFLLGIRVSYGTDSGKPVQTSQIISIGQVIEYGDIKPVVFKADGTPDQALEFTSCDGGQME